MAFDTSTYAGYGQSLQSLSNAVGKFSERLAQKKEEEKNLKALKSAYRPYYEDLGYMSAEQFDNADAREITKRVQAQHFKAGMDEIQQQRKMRDAVQAFGRDFGSGPAAPLPSELAMPPGSVGETPRFDPGLFRLGPDTSTLPDVPAGAIAQFAQTGEPAQTPSDPAFASAVQRYAQTPPASASDRLFYALERNPQAISSPQVGDFISNVARMEALKAQQAAMQARAAEAANPPPALGSYVGETREVPGKGTMIFNGKSWEFVKDEKPAAPDDSMPIGSVRTLEDGTKLIGLGPGRAPQVVPPEKDRSEALNVDQGNAQMFANRMDYNERIIGDLMSSGKFDPTSAAVALQSIDIKTPGYVPNIKVPEMLRSKELKSYEAATSNWAGALLRRESGKNLTDVERAAVYKEYFPQVGDPPEVVQEKAERRKMVARDMRRSAGPISESMPGMPAPAGPSSTATNATPSAPSQLLRFRTVEEAAKAGAKSGDVVLLYDQTRNGYRRFRIP